MDSTVKKPIPFSPGRAFIQVMVQSTIIGNLSHYCKQAETSEIFVYIVYKAYFYTVLGDLCDQGDSLVWVAALGQ